MSAPPAHAAAPRSRFGSIRRSRTSISLYKNSGSPVLCWLCQTSVTRIRHFSWNAFLFFFPRAKRSLRSILQVDCVSIDSHSASISRRSVEKGWRAFHAVGLQTLRWTEWSRNSKLLLLSYRNDCGAKWCGWAPLMGNGGGNQRPRASHRSIRPD